MKSVKTKGLCILVLLSASVLQGCVADVYYSPGGSYGWGRPGWGGRGRWYRGGFRGRVRWLPESGAMSVTENTAALQEQTAITLSKDFGIRLDSARKIAALCQSKDLKNNLKTLGLDIDDFASLKKLEMPTTRGVQAIANLLHEDSIRIEAIFSSFIADMRASN
jgi:hypothetical protein